MMHAPHDLVTHIDYYVPLTMPHTSGTRPRANGDALHTAGIRWKPADWIGGRVQTGQESSGSAEDGRTSNGGCSGMPKPSTTIQGGVPPSLHPTAASHWTGEAEGLAGAAGERRRHVPKADETLLKTIPLPYKAVALRLRNRCDVC